MTTVTGLPSTPSRNAMRQPHARRACVKPFSIQPGSYHAGAWPVLEQGLDFALEDVLAGEAGMRRTDFSIARNHDADGDAHDRSIGVLDIVMIESLKHRIIHLHVADVRRQFVGGVVHGDPDDLQTSLAVLVLELDEMRNFDFARTA